MNYPPAIIVAGPTASGKSALALDLAVRLAGEIVNADSMQVYRELRILTARPTPAEEARVPHRLYGIRSAADPGSAALWRQAARAAMEEAHAAGRIPILCGGTGLYLAALTQGIADIPEPGPEVRAEARSLLAQLGPAGLHARLAAEDPVTASRLGASDSQRIARGWEVWRSTGRGLAEWQSKPGEPAPWRFAAILLNPPRQALRAAISARFRAMLEAGAVEEVRALLALGLDPALPAMRALGVRELASHVRGEIGLDEAALRAERATAQYAKRQATWFRHHPLAPEARSVMIDALHEGFSQFSESISAELGCFIRNRC